MTLSPTPRSNACIVIFTRGTSLPIIRSLVTNYAIMGVLATLTVRTWMAFLLPDVMVAVILMAFPGVAEYFGIVKLMFRVALSLLDKLSI